jgi:hypothetical protein
VRIDRLERADRPAGALRQVANDPPHGNGHLSPERFIEALTGPASDLDRLAAMPA